MLLDLLTTEPFLTRLTLPFGLAWAALLGYLLWRVGQAALNCRSAYMAWWYVAGLVLLPAAPLAEAPFVFGLGAGLMLIGAWHPLAFRRPRTDYPAQVQPRPAWQWSPVALLFGVALLTAFPNYLGLGTGLALVLQAAVRLGSALSWGRKLGQRGAENARLAAPATSAPANLLLRPPPPKPPPAKPHVHWGAATKPATPELGLALQADELQLFNLTQEELVLLGWMPLEERSNGFFPLEQVLASRATYALRWNSRWHGVQVWYSPQSDHSEVRLLRAKWLPPGATHSGAARLIN